MSAKVYNLLILLIFVFAACHSPQTPDFSHTENESNIPEGQRTSDSNRYDGKVTDTVSNNSTQGRTDNSVNVNTNSTDEHNSQKATDSTSGSRITSDGNDLKNYPTPDSRSVQSQIKSKNLPDHGKDSIH